MVDSGVKQLTVVVLFVYTVND